MPSKPDTFAEVVEWLSTQAADYINPQDPDRKRLEKAARLLAAAGEEVRAARAEKLLGEHPHDDGSEWDWAVRNLELARKNLDLLAPELKENDHAG